MEILKWSDGFDVQWIQQSINNETVEWSQRFGYYLADSIKRDKVNNPIQAKNKDGSLKTKFNKKTNKKEPEFENQNPLTTSQLRKFFGEIRRIQADLLGKKDFDKTDLILLKPKLAYQVGREKDRLGKIKDFYIQLSTAIDAVNGVDDFKRFVKIVEAIVAYHKEAESQKSTNEDQEN